MENQSYKESQEQKRNLTSDKGPYYKGCFFHLAETTKEILESSSQNDLNTKERECCQI